MKSIAVLLFWSLLLFACSTSKYELKNEREYEIISYFEITEMAHSKLKEISEAAPTPEIGEFLQGSLKYFNRSEYRKTLATLLASKFSDQEMDYIINYIKSPQGVDTQVVFKNIANPAVVNGLFASLNNENKKAIEKFMASPAGGKFGTFLGSPELRSMNNSYGELLGCRYLSEHKKSEFKVVQGQGKCLNI